MEVFGLLGLFCFAIGVGGLILAARGALRAAGALRPSLRRDRTGRDFLSEPYGILGVLFLAGFFMLAPVTACKMFNAGGDPIAGATALDWFASNLYATVQALVMQNDLLDYAGAIFGSPAAGVLAFFGGSTIFKALYSFVLFLYLIALPAALAFFAFDAVFNGLKEFILCRFLHRTDTVYVFNGTSAAAEALATSIASEMTDSSGTGAHAVCRPPLLVFCPSGLHADGTTEESIRDAVGDRVRTHFTKVAFEDVPALACKTFKALETETRCALPHRHALPRMHFVAIQDACDINVRATIRATDEVLRAIELYSLDTVARDVSKLTAVTKDGETDISPDILTPIDRVLSRLSFTCLQDNPDDDLVFDTLAERRPAPDIARHAGSFDGTLADAELEGLKAFNRCIRNRMEVHLTSVARKEIYDVLVDHPLYGVLEQVDLKQPERIYHQLLVVLVAGLGERGMQALRSAYWAGRLPGVELRIVAVDRNASSAAEALAASCPAMLAEQTTAGGPTVYSHGTGIGPALAPNAVSSNASARMVPTVRFCEMDVQSSSFTALLQGDPLASFAYDPDGNLGGSPTASASGHFAMLPAEPLIPTGARVYAFVTLDNDGLSLNCALSIQRHLLNRVVDAASAHDGLVAQTVGGTRPSPIERPTPAIIAPRIRSGEIMESVVHLADSAAATLTIHPFGSTSSTFTRERILDSHYERLAIQLCGAYDSAWRVPDALAGGLPIDSTAPSYERTLRTFNKAEIEKVSNRCAARFLPYRLWMMGYTPNHIK